MVRACSMFGLGGIFLAISPKLREQTHDALGSVVSSVELYSPYSYVALGILVIATLVFSLYRSSRAR